MLTEIAQKGFARAISPVYHAHSPRRRYVHRQLQRVAPRPTVASSVCAVAANAEIRAVGARLARGPRTAVATCAQRRPSSTDRCLIRRDTGYLTTCRLNDIHHRLPMLFIATAGSHPCPFMSKSFSNRLPNRRCTAGDQSRFSL